MHETTGQDTAPATSRLPLNGAPNGSPSGSQPPGGRAPRRLWLAPSVWLPIIGLLVLSSCERTPSKSDYVSDQVTALCKGQTGDELRACRIAVIKQFQDTPLEELQRRFPKPEPRARPSCGA